MMNDERNRPREAEEMLLAADMHTHILPQMDDGSRSTAMSAQLLQSLAEQGIQAVCFTPHYYVRNETIADFAARRAEALAAVQEILPKEIRRVNVGAEVAFFDGISRCQELEQLCLHGTKSLLLEMPFRSWSRRETEEVISLVWDRDIHVILAHPERFLFSDKNRAALEELARLPISLQVNADTVCSWRTRRQALGLLELSGAPLLGSDCHDPKTRPPRMEKARRIIEAKLGHDFLREMDSRAAEIMKG